MIKTYIGRVRATHTGEMSRRMKEFRPEFIQGTMSDTHVAEPLEPGSLNVILDEELTISGDFEIDKDYMPNNEKFLFQHCWINGLPCYRIRPYNRETGTGGHGDTEIEIVSDVHLRTFLKLKECDEVRLMFIVDDQAETTGRVEELEASLSRAHLKIENLEKELAEKMLEAEQFGALLGNASFQEAVTQPSTS